MKTNTEKVILKPGLGDEYKPLKQGVEYDAIQDPSNEDKYYVLLDNDAGESVCMYAVALNFIEGK